MDAERFWSHVDRSDPSGCWPWLASRTRGGYGQTQIDGERKAHRAAYKLLVGPIPKGLTLDHLCRNRLCANPSHLEVVTRGENVLRGMGITALNLRKTHCGNGHAFTPENTGRDSRGHRMCRTCRRDWRRAYQPEWRRRRRLERNVA